METLDPAASTWAFDANSALHHDPSVWPAYVPDEYCNPLEENLSDSDSSLDSPSYGLYFNPVTEVQTTEPMLVSSGTVEYQTDMQGQQTTSSEWSYGTDAHMTQVYSPNSITTDSETAGDQDFVVPQEDSSDETSQLYDDDSMEDEDSYSTSVSSTSSVTASPTDNTPTRQTRTSARGEHMKQVQAMIRQVNSAVDPKATASVKATPTIKSKPKENSKKRARVEPDIRSVTLTRDQLLTMTSEELDDFTRRLKDDHALTAHELREIKRQRRLIKNREYAQASRVKKKGVLTDLSVKFSELEEERAQLIQRVNLLEEENASLRAKLQMPAANRAPLPFMASAAASDPFQPPKAKRPRGRNATAAMVGGGASLFALVLLAATFFGFGNFGAFNPFSSQAQVPPPPASSPHMAQHHFGSQDYSTFRMMDIRSVSETDPSTTDSPPEDLLHSQPLQASASISNTILTMEDLLADEHIVFSSNNASMELLNNQPEQVQAH